MLLLRSRAEVEALTFDEVIVILEQSERDTVDARIWARALAFPPDKAMDAYNELREAMDDDTLDEVPSLDEHPQRDFLRAQ